MALTLTFLTPALPDDLDILSRPVTYLTYEVRATDGKSARRGNSTSTPSAEMAVNTPDQQVVWAREQVGWPGSPEDRLARTSRSWPNAATTSASTGATCTWPRRRPQRPGVRSLPRQASCGAASSPTACGGGRRPSRARAAAASCRGRRCCFRLGQGRRGTRLAVADAGLRRPVLDPVHEAEPAAVLAPRRLGGRRFAAGFRPGLRVAATIAAPRSTRS